MGTQQELQSTNYLCDEIEHDEYVFYCELEKQVLQLTAEDEDEEEAYESKNSDMIKVQKEGINHGGSVPLARAYYNWPMSKDLTAPAWMMNLWRTGNGTGVFIPQIAQSKKMNRSRRKKNERGRRTYKRVEKI